MLGMWRTVMMRSGGGDDEEDEDDDVDELFLLRVVQSNWGCIFFMSDLRTADTSVGKPHTHIRVCVLYNFARNWPFN